MAEPRKRAWADDSAKKQGSSSQRNRSKNREQDGDGFGRVAEAIARFMGTPAFLAGMTVFCGVWLGWNTLMPKEMQFDPRDLNFTLLTLILSLQASYAAPLLLLSDNRQADRDRVQAEQDRQSNERAHATTEFITREIASLRIAMADVATRDYVRGELRDLLEELQNPDDGMPEASENDARASDPTPAKSTELESLRGALRQDIRDILREELASIRTENSAHSPATLSTLEGDELPR